MSNYSPEDTGYLSDSDREEASLAQRAYVEGNGPLTPRQEQVRAAVRASTVAGAAVRATNKASSAPVVAAAVFVAALTPVVETIEVVMAESRHEARLTFERSLGRLGPAPKVRIGGKVYASPSTVRTAKAWKDGGYEAWAFVGGQPRAVDFCELAEGQVWFALDRAGVEALDKALQGRVAALWRPARGRPAHALRSRWPCPWTGTSMRRAGGRLLIASASSFACAPEA